MKRYFAVAKVTRAAAMTVPPATVFAQRQFHRMAVNIFHQRYTFRQTMRMCFFLHRVAHSPRNALNQRILCGLSHWLLFNGKILSSLCSVRARPSFARRSNVLAPMYIIRFGFARVMCRSRTNKISTKYEAVGAVGNRVHVQFKLQRKKWFWHACASF